MWEEKGFGLGTVILVDDTLVVLSDEGELALIEANAEKYSELARFQVLSRKGKLDSTNIFQWKVAL